MGESRKKYLIVRMSEHEKKRVEAAAKHMGISVSSFVRVKCLEFLSETEKEKK